MSSGTPRLLIIVLGVGLSVGWLGEAIARRRLVRSHQETVKARQALELQMGEIRADREKLAASLTGEQERVERLSQTLSAKDSELQAVIGRLTEEERIIQGLQGELLAMQQQVERMDDRRISRQPRTSASGESAAMVELEKVVVTQATTSPGIGIEGRVLSVHPEWEFVIIDLGWNIVNIGDLVSIYHNEQLVGTARIERVQEQVSAASLVLEPDAGKPEVRINDVVRAL